MKVTVAVDYPDAMRCIQENPKLHCIETQYSSKDRDGWHEKFDCNYPIISPEGVTLLHHGNFEQEFSPCLAQYGEQREQEFLISHFDLDVLGAIMELTGTKPLFSDSFWKSVALIDILGGKMLPFIPKGDRDIYFTIEYYLKRVNRLTNRLYIEEWVEEVIRILTRLFANKEPELSLEAEKYRNYLEYDTLTYLSKQEGNVVMYKAHGDSIPLGCLQNFNGSKIILLDLWNEVTVITLGDIGIDVKSLLKERFGNSSGSKTKATSCLDRSKQGIAIEVQTMYNKLRDMSVLEPIFPVIPGVTHSPQDLQKIL